MKKVLYKLGVYFLSLFFLIIFLFFFTGYISANDRLGTTYKKQNRLVQIDQPKIILVGGSSLHYGINSRLLEEKFKIPVVNMGIHAGIGLRYMFGEILSEINPNDIILLLAEPGHYSSLDIDGEKSLYRLLSKYPEGIRHLTFKQYINSVRLIGPVVKDNLEYFVRLIINRTKDRSTILEKTDKWGDYFGHKDKQSIFKPSPVGQVDHQISGKTLSFLQEMNIELQNKKAHFFISFAPTAKSAAIDKLSKEIESNLLNLFGSEILIGHPETYILPDSFFYDSSHHLLFDKRNQRTNLLIADIQSNKFASKFFENN